MKRVKRKRIAVIEAENAVLFEIAINNKYDELAEYDYTLEIEHHQPHTAYIHYEYDEYIPESLADEFRLKGINYKCESCRYYDPYKNEDGSIDKRRNEAYCKHHKRKVRPELDACDIFYFELVSKSGQFDKTSSVVDEVPVMALEERTTRKNNKHAIVGGNLKALREGKGVTMKEAAKEIGVPYTTYRSWEIGRNRLAGPPLKAVAEYYGCEVNDILKVTAD